MELPCETGHREKEIDILLPEVVSQNNQIDPALGWFSRFALRGMLQIGQCRTQRAGLSFVKTDVFSGQEPAQWRWIWEH